MDLSKTSVTHVFISGIPDKVNGSVDEYSTKSMTNIKEKLSRHHKTNGKKITSSVSIRKKQKFYKCPFCTKCFKSKLWSMIHEVTHAPEIPYQCVKCMLLFRFSGELYKHRKSCVSSICNFNDNFLANDTNANKTTIYDEDRQAFNVDSPHFLTFEYRNLDGGYTCPQCGVTVNSKYYLKQHLKIHTGIKPHQCRHCSRAFLRTYDLKRHLKTVHKIKMELKAYDNMRERLKIKRMMEKKEPPSGPPLPLGKDLRQYVSYLDGDRPWTCGLCANQFASNSGIYRHLRRYCLKKSGIEVSKEVIDWAAKKMGTRDLRQYAVMADDGTDRPWSCSLCGNKLSSRSGIYRHLRKHCVKRENIGIEMDKQAKQRSKPRIPIPKFSEIEAPDHLIQNGKISPDLSNSVMVSQAGPSASTDVFTCFDCHLNFATQKEFDRHMHSAHRNTRDEGPKSCPCGKKFKFSSLCYLHMSHCPGIPKEKSRSKSSEGFPEKFDPEPPAYPTNLSLPEAHIQEMVEIKENSGKAKQTKMSLPLPTYSYQCFECGKYLKNESSLRSHLNTHTPVRMHPCDQCNKSFKRSADLRRHMVLHSEVKPFQCIYCGEQFKWPYQYKKHETMSCTVDVKVKLSQNTSTIVGAKK